ncbi:MAG TPA: hypothetical protein VFR08_13280 [Candidatus Angelobacter sp.]|nr:hypothetical protein [Candidatus Angelobacter sp.]
MVVVLPGVVEVGLVEVGLDDVGLVLLGLVLVGDPGMQGFATVAEVPAGVELVLLLVLVPVVEPMVVLDVPVVVPLVLHGPATVPVPLVPIPVEMVPVWLGVVVVLWLGVVVEVTPVDVEVVPEGVEVVPDGVVVCVELDPVIDGLVVVTAPALPVVPWVGDVAGDVCVADGVVCVTEGLPLLMAPPGAVVVELVPVCVPDVPAVPVLLPAVPALPVVWAAATPIASVSAKAVKNPLCIVSLNSANTGRLFDFFVTNHLDAGSQITGCGGRLSSSRRKDARRTPHERIR